MELMEKILGMIPEGGNAVVMSAAVLEMVMRLMKTEKPYSLLYAASKVMGVAGKVLSKAGDLLDKLIPQRIKELPPEEPEPPKAA